MNRIKPLWPVFLILLLTGAQSCSYKKRNILFKTPNKIKSSKTVFISDIEGRPLSDDSITYRHRIKTGDRLNIRFLQNFDLGSAASQSATSSANQAALMDEQKGYLVNYDSTVTLPIIGRVNLVGMTRLEAAKKLESLYEPTVVGVIIDVNIYNLSVNVLGDVNNPGKIYLDKEDTHLADVIARAGGFREGSKKNTVQIIRNNEVIQVNMLDVRSAFDNRTIIHDNDIVYIRPYGFKADMEPVTVTSSSLVPILTVLQITIISVQFYFLLRN